MTAPRCAVCSEPVIRDGAVWRHRYGDAHCGTGDGATAAPRNNRRRVWQSGELHSTYRGCHITRAGSNNAGLRWHAFTPAGAVRADTLQGIRDLIRARIGA